LYDRVHRSAKALAAQDLVIVGIDAASIEKLGEWPWARDVHATLIERLRADGASVIAWTVPFGSVASGNENQRVREALSLLESSARRYRIGRPTSRIAATSTSGVDPDSHLATR
jgi:CHASE2 domain-containing sensor protein